MFGLVHRGCADELPGDVVDFRGRADIDDVCHGTAIVNGNECCPVADLGFAVNTEGAGREKRSRLGRMLAFSPAAPGRLAVRYADSSR